MFQPIKDNLSLVAIGLLSVALLVAGFNLVATKATLKTAQAELDRAELVVSTLQTDLDGATADLLAAEAEKKRLMRDASLVASTLEQREQGRHEADRQSRNVSSKAQAIIERGQGHEVENWANTAVPIELSRLLKQATDCANGDSDRAKVCATAKRVNQPVQGASVRRGDKPRALPALISFSHSPNAMQYRLARA